MCRRNVVNPNPPANHYEFWENEVMRKLGKAYANHTDKELAAMFERTVGAIRTRVCILRIVVRMSPYAHELGGISNCKRSKSAKRRVATPEGKAQMKAAQAKAYTPEANAKKSAAMKAYWAKRKASKK